MIKQIQIYICYNLKFQPLSACLDYPNYTTKITYSIFQLAGKTHLVSFDWSKNTGAIDVEMNASVLEEKSSFKMLGLSFSFKLDWGSYLISIGKTAFKKIGAFICSMKFLSPEVALDIFKSTIQPCMKYCCHV